MAGKQPPWQRNARRTLGIERDERGKRKKCLGALSLARFNASGCLVLNSSKREEGILVTRAVFSLYLNVKKAQLLFCLGLLFSCFVWVFVFLGENAQC